MRASDCYGQVEARDLLV